VLYLAEVVQKRGLMGSRSELKLLACQKGEQWSAISNEDPIPSDDASNYKDGALVLVDAIGSGADRKIKNIQDGARQIVTLLQGYSRQQEKTKSQEEEIQQWMESLTFQSQELNRREMELESSREQLEQMQQELQQLERQRQEVQQSREAIERLQQEAQHKTQELNQAWAQLRAEQDRLQQERASLQQEAQHAAQSAGLDMAQAQQLQQLLQQTAEGVVAADFLRSSVETCLQITAAQESLLQAPGESEGGGGLSPELRDWITAETQALSEAWHTWADQRDRLDQARSEWRGRQATLEAKQEQLEAIDAQVAAHQALKALVEQAVGGESTSDASQRVDRGVLEAMDLGELQELVSQLQRDLEKLSRLVNEEEEELTAKRQAIEELQNQLSHASEYDRLKLEADIADERDGCQMLEETLVGQRRNLQERQDILRVHQAVLCKRQGLAVPRPDGSVDLSPILEQVTQELQALETFQGQLRDHISTLQSAVQEAEITVNQQAGDLQAQLEVLQERERQLQAQQSKALASSGGKGSNDLLQPMAEQVGGLRQHLEALLSHLSHAVETSHSQQEAIAQMQQIIATLARSTLAR
jgi:chromosome segregation ATPase